MTVEKGALLVKTVPVETLETFKMKTRLYPFSYADLLENSGTRVKLQLRKYRCLANARNSIVTVTMPVSFHLRFLVTNLLRCPRNKIKGGPNVALLVSDF